MGYSICLVVAACMPGDMPPTPASAPCVGCASAPDCCNPTPHEGLLARLRRLFHRSSADCNPCSPCTGTISSESMSPPVVQVMPAPLPPAPPQVTQARHTDAPATEIKRAYLPRLGNAEDYSWVTGQLFYIHAGGEGIWVLRYAPLDREDRYGGGMVLAEAVSMSKLREGDLVTIHGDVLNEGRASKYLGGPLYRVQSVQLIDRAD